MPHYIQPQARQTDRPRSSWDAALIQTPVDPLTGDASEYALARYCRQNGDGILARQYRDRLKREEIDKLKAILACLLPPD